MSPLQTSGQMLYTTKNERPFRPLMKVTVCDEVSCVVVLLWLSELTNAAIISPIEFSLSFWKNDDSDHVLHVSSLLQTMPKLSPVTNLEIQVGTEVMIIILQTPLSGR